MSKKLLSALLILAITLAACSGSTGASAGSTAPAPAPAPAGSTPAESAPALSDGKAVKPEGYPKGNISFIVSSSAGSATDLAARTLNDCLDLGGNVVIENISGGSQTVGTTEFINRPADGQTVVLMANAGLISQPLIADVAYSADDMRLLSKIYPDCIAVAFVSPDSEIKTAEDFMAFISSGEPFNYGCANIGGYAHMAFSEALMQLDLLDRATPVAYDGSQKVMQAVLTGELPFALLDDNFIRGYVENGELNAVMTLYDGPSPLLPDVAGIDHYGVTGMSDMVGIKYLAVRADTPEEIVAWVKQQVDEAVMSDAFQQFLETSGVGTMDRVYTEEELTEATKNAVEKARAILTATGYIH